MKREKSCVQLLEIPSGSSGSKCSLWILMTELGLHVQANSSTLLREVRAHWGIIKFCITATCLLAHAIVIVTPPEQCHVLGNPSVFVLKDAGRDDGIGSNLQAIFR
jgi:hypothetical protein